MIQKITLYSDGACSPNPGAGGYGAVIVYEKTGHAPYLFSRGFKLTTNNRMELLAVIEPLETLNEKYNITVITDSQYVANALNKGWIKNWSKNNWKTSAKKSVKNQDLWARLIHLLNKHDIKMQWVRGHSGHLENQSCDDMAVEARQNNNLHIDKGYNKKCDIPKDILKKECQDFKDTLKDCKKGKHKLVILFSFEQAHNDLVVRWCETCGSVVVDRDSDGRIYPGAIRKMRIPDLPMLVLKKGTIANADQRKPL